MPSPRENQRASDASGADTARTSAVSMPADGEVLVFFPKELVTVPSPQVLTDAQLQTFSECLNSVFEADRPEGLENESNFRMAVAREIVTKVTAKGFHPYDGKQYLAIAMESPHFKHQGKLSGAFATVVNHWRSNSEGEGAHYARKAFDPDSRSILRAAYRQCKAENDALPGDDNDEASESASEATSASSSS